MSKAFENEILKSLELLTKQQQEEALAYIKSLLKVNSPADLLSFAGIIDSNSAKEMQQAIEEGCEKIDHNEW
ncbi:MAG: hypothetical protein J0L67_13610 [Cytophagales bacterium]|nr:hypothetical protein [Cytophagales bacterium]